METKSKGRLKERKSVAAKARPRKYYKGRPMYTEADLQDPNFKFPLPPEPEWEAEWHKRNPGKS